MTDLFTPSAPSDDADTNTRYQRDLYWRRRRRNHNHNSAYWNSESNRLAYVLSGDLSPA